MTKEQLVAEAVEAMKMSYSPYSHFRVGAALLAKDGTVFRGCNIENSGFSPTNCAERTAMFKAISEGVRDFKAIAVVGGREGKIEDFCAPCGVCRQVLCEFCSPDLPVYLFDGKNYKTYTLGELLPASFSLA